MYFTIRGFFFLQNSLSKSPSVDHTCLTFSAVTFRNSKCGHSTCESKGISQLRWEYQKKIDLLTYALLTYALLPVEILDDIIGQYI